MGENDMVLGERLLMSKCNSRPQFERKNKFLNPTTWCVNEHFRENKLFLRIGF
jgi:hypothetical protein